MNRDYGSYWAPAESRIFAVKHPSKPRLSRYIADASESLSRFGGPSAIFSRRLGGNTPCPSQHLLTAQSSSRITRATQPFVSLSLSFVIPSLPFALFIRQTPSLTHQRNSPIHCYAPLIEHTFQSLNKFLHIPRPPSRSFLHPPSMLNTMRKSWLLFTIFALVAFTSAVDIAGFDVDGVANFVHGGKRQAASGTGNSNPSTSDAPKSTQAPSSNPPSTPTQTPTQQPSSQQPSSQAPSSAAPSSAAPSTKAPSSTPAPSSNPPKTRTSAEVITSALLGTSVQQYTTVFTTVSNGQSIEITETGSRTSVFSTGQAVITQKPDPQNGNGGGSSSGLTDSNKKIIGGVVGGVGGAILLGGIAIVCWRIWGRKKRVSEDDDDLMAGTGSALGDKPAPNNTPFQSNLEQYHNPGGRPNAAANF
ncbi:uncharacterized protein BDR25DRAFT_359061 [Lindgomyces ingoldianus]|uniref:Uncharacterized protein n=1 Tax=Lindgomyces ingoldianus TaxID=673940 RepID=A0ACB6QL22_9PLEO|nr:uncharacterized protein BDR25DRAFT_359061 [Lindgomyces ingoldianus]KAF2467007.1 hypothetical protein BDR25DRAFT_359061 [Lindgomyces ingoldianus]